MFAGIYYGGMYGGSTTSILLNTPGESSTVVTAIEGHKMAKAGRAAQALATAAIGSFVAGTIGTALLAFCAPVVVRFAIALGAPSYLAIMLLALVAVTAVLGTSRVRGFASLALGLAIGLIGMDPVTGQRRLTFGEPQLVDGIDIVVIAVAIFAVGEALWVAAHLRRSTSATIPVGRPWMSRQDWGRSWKPWLRGTAFGFPFGALPAGGAEIPTFLSYVTEKRLSKRPEEFGHGAIEGVAGPEAANNASAAGTLVPMLSLGLPTNATAAIMLAALIQFGIQPGPLLLEREPELVWGLIASLFIGNALLLVINLPLAPGVGEAAADPPAVPVRRHPLLRHARCLLGQHAAVRPGAAARARAARSAHAALRPAGPAADHRRDHRPARRGADAPRAPAQRRGRLRAVERAAGGRDLRDHRGHPAVAAARRAGAARPRSARAWGARRRRRRAAAVDAPGPRTRARHGRAPDRSPSPGQTTEHSTPTTRTEQR